MDIRLRRKKSREVGNVGSDSILRHHPFYCTGGFCTEYTIFSFFSPANNVVGWFEMGAVLVEIKPGYLLLGTLYRRMV